MISKHAPDLVGGRDPGGYDLLRGVGYEFVDYDLVGYDFNAKYNSHTDPIFRELKLLKISDLYSAQEFRFVFKLEKRLLPKYFLNKSYLRHSDRHDYDTRNAQNFELLKSKHQFTSKSICYRVPEILNDENDSYSDILNKINTHSLSGYMKYIKMWYINSYKSECLEDDCYRCNKNV